MDDDLLGPLADLPLALPHVSGVRRRGERRRRRQRLLGSGMAVVLLLGVAGLVHGLTPGPARDRLSPAAGPGAGSPGTRGRDADQGPSCQPSPAASSAYSSCLSITYDGSYVPLCAQTDGQSSCTRDPGPPVVECASPPDASGDCPVADGSVAPVTGATYWTVFFATGPDLRSAQLAAAPYLLVGPVTVSRLSCWSDAPAAVGRPGSDQAVAVAFTGRPEATQASRTFTRPALAVLHSTYRC